MRHDREDQAENRVLMGKERERAIQRFMAWYENRLRFPVPLRTAGSPLEAFTKEHIKRVALERRQRGRRRNEQ